MDKCTFQQSMSVMWWEKVEGNVVLLASRAQFLEKTPGESLDLNLVLGTAHTNGRAALSQLLVWIQFGPFSLQLCLL